VASKLTEVMTYPVHDNGTGFFSSSAYAEIADFVRDKDVIVMGPGLSQDPDTAVLARKLYATIDKPFVIDADGINAFQGRADIIRKTKRQAVFTPHPGELSRLTGVKPKDINNDRMGVGLEFVHNTGVNLVLKGASTIIVTEKKDLYINPTGNPSLAKGGSGDILTGFVGGFISQGYSMVESSLLGAYLHGYIADSWVEKNTDMDLLAGDLLDGLGQAMRDIRNGNDRVYIEKSL
jgi:NAD(P)H-hydrate epimerase